jgi:hypothetical protein
VRHGSPNAVRHLTWCSRGVLTAHEPVVGSTSSRGRATSV